MSDDQLLSLEALKSCHAKEKKELQGKITSLKHSVTKNDKKRKKEVQAEIELLEKELKVRHDKELDELEAKLESVQLEDDKETKVAENEQASAEKSTPKKLTKTQKQRDKKAELERKRALAVKLDEENAATSRGNLEAKEINEILQQASLKLVDIPSDGDCLFNALAHQLNLADPTLKITGDLVRKKAANYMRHNCDEFIPFLDESAADKVGFENYCMRVEKSCVKGGDWGTATELKAVSLALERPIKVINSNAVPHIFGEEFSSKPLIVTYHRYLLTSGEHYNSTEPI